GLGGYRRVRVVSTGSTSGVAVASPSCGGAALVLHGQGQREDRARAGGAQGTGGERDGPAGVDEVVDQQHGSAVDRFVEVQVEPSRYGRHALGRVRRALAWCNPGIDDAPAADDRELEEAGQPFREVAGQLRASSRLDVDDAGRS